MTPNISGENEVRVETELICTKFPVVSEFITHKMAKIQERAYAILVPNLPFKPSLI